MMKSVLIAGVAGSIIVLVFGNLLTSVGSTVFPSSPMLGTAATGFGIGVGVQVTVRLLGVS